MESKNHCTVYVDTLYLWITW